MRTPSLRLAARLACIAEDAATVYDATLAAVVSVRPPQPVQMRGPEDVFRQCSDLPRMRRECFKVLVLNARHECVAVELISLGSLNASIVHPREIFLPAILLSAASVILVHNHPSGDAEPSEEDLSITRRLVQAGTLLGIEVLDHVILASRGVVSLRARNMM